MAQDTSIYRSVLEAVEAAVLALTEPGGALEGWRVTLRKEPSLVAEQDRFPQVVISPSRNLGQIPLRKIFGRGASVGYEVVVGAFVDARWEIEQLWVRLAAMEALRLALWDVGLAEVVEGGFDADYQPAFFEGGQAPPNADGNWVKCVYAVKTVRTGASGR